MEATFEGRVSPPFFFARRMLSLLRLDDRLIHGQVMAVWVRALAIRRILVLNDAAAHDDFARTLMQAAMPPQITLQVAPVAEAAPLLDALTRDAAPALVLFARVEDVVAAHHEFPLPHCNVGNLGMREGRRLIWRSVALSAAEHAALGRLQSAGVDVFLQMIPADQKQRLPAPA